MLFFPCKGKNMDNATDTRKLSHSLLQQKLAILDY